MLKYFCDVCEKDLGEERGKPFVRYLFGYVASALIMKDGKPAADVCQSCISNIFKSGADTPPPKEPVEVAVATLQPVPSADSLESPRYVSSFNPPELG